MASNHVKTSTETIADILHSNFLINWMYTLSTGVLLFGHIIWSVAPHFFPAVCVRTF
jgi:hypothetical protein